MIDGVRSAVQHLRVYFHTWKGTEFTDPNYGFDGRGILNSPWARQFGYKHLIAPAIEEAVNELANFISSIEIMDVKTEDKVLTVKLVVTARNGENSTMDLVIGE